MERKTYIYTFDITNLKRKFPLLKKRDNLVAVSVFDALFELFIKTQKRKMESGKSRISDIDLERTDKDIVCFFIVSGKIVKVRCRLFNVAGPDSEKRVVLVGGVIISSKDQKAALVIYNKFVTFLKNLSIGILIEVAREKLNKEDKNILNQTVKSFFFQTV